MGAGDLLRDLFTAACCALVLVSAATSLRAGEAPKRADPEFRLLELGGRHVRWTLPEGGLPATIRYGFVTQPQEFRGARNCDAMLAPDALLKPSGISFADFRREVRAAFSAWEETANITFVETQSLDEAGILIGADAKARGRAFTNVALRDAAAGASAPAAGMGVIRQSLICLNPLRPWKIGFDGNLDVYDLRFTVTHEIGHAIGLDHPSPAGQLMSFRYVEHGRGLQPGDAAGAIALYGQRGGSPLPSHNATAAASSRPAGGSTTPSADRAFGLGEPAPAARR